MKAQSTATFVCAAALIAAFWLYPAAGNESYDRAESFYAQSRFDEAIAELTDSLAYDPYDSRAYFLRANAYYNKADFTHALEDLDAGLSLMPECAQAYYNRAVVYYSSQEYDRAWEDVLRASSMGYVLDPIFIEQLKEDSGRER